MTTLKTILMKSIIDFIISISIVASIFGDAIKEAMTIVLIAITVAIVNALFEFALLPLIKHIVEKIKTKTPKHIDDKLDKFVNDLEKKLTEKKDEIIAKITKEDDDNGTD